MVIGLINLLTYYIRQCQRAWLCDKVTLPELGSWSGVLIAGSPGQDVCASCGTAASAVGRWSVATLSQYIIAPEAYLSPAQSAWRRAGKTIAGLNPGSVSAAPIVVDIINTMRQCVRNEIDDVGGPATRAVPAARTTTLCTWHVTAVAFPTDRKRTAHAPSSAPLAVSNIHTREVTITILALNWFCK